MASASPRSSPGCAQETAAHPTAQMQIAPEQGAFLRLLVEVLGARRCLEIGTFTGYSSLAVALALPDDGTIVCCDVSEEYTAGRPPLLGRGRGRAQDRPADRAGGRRRSTRCSRTAREGTFDLAFIDADKDGYPDYWERCVALVRPGGVIAVDNVLWGGDVADPSNQDRDTPAPGGQRARRRATSA